MRNKLESKPEVKVQEPEANDECCHYWLIESANGPTSKGVCKFCGVEKEFHNSPPEYAFSKRRDEKIALPDTPPREVHTENDGSDTASK